MSLVERPAPPPDRRRITVAAAIVLIGCLAILVRLWYLQVLLGDELYEASERNRVRVLRRPPPRGLILDAEGDVLASIRSRIVLSVLPEAVDEDPTLLPRLARLIGQPREALIKTYNENKIDSVQPVRLVWDVGMAVATRVEERLHTMPGVMVGPEPVRSYSGGPAYGHVLGYVGQCSKEDLERRAEAGYKRGDVCGKTGVEGGPFDAQLRGKDGGITVEVDALGRIVGELATTEPVAGATLRLNIVGRLQRLAYRRLSEHARRGHPGALVAVDPQSGRVLALVSVPSYDPARFEGGIPAREWNKLRDDPLRPLINRAVASATAPGSVFKVITAAAGLESGQISVYDRTYCSGVIYLGRWPKRCHKRSGHGSVDLTQAIAKSCDVSFYRLGQRLGPETMARYARLFGFGERAGIDLPGAESAGIVPDPQWKRLRKLGPWVGGDTVDYAIGQSMLGCTPLQVCTAISAIANGGVIYAPQLVGSVITHAEDGSEQAARVEPQIRRRLSLRGTTLPAIIRGMEAVMKPGGTAAHCALPGVRVAGKTGTAQRRRRGEYVDDAWFAAFAPVENPRIAVCVYVEGGGHGGATAAPIARDIIAEYLGVKAGELATAPASGD